jgi:hypothetical protein
MEWEKMPTRCGRAKTASRFPRAKIILKRPVAARIL